MDAHLTEAWLAMLLPASIGFALPKALRRPFLMVSVVVLVISLFGQGVHDTHFFAYFYNLFFLIGSIARECANLFIRFVRRLSRRHI